MTPLAKLAGFGAVLALVFAGAALAGSQADVDRGVEAAPMAGHGEGAPQAVRGLAVSEHGLTLELVRRTARPGERFDLAFRIVDRSGRVVRDFDVEHTKRMHVIVVRRDMTGFQHVHPVLRGDGTWSVPATLADPGTYRVFADFSVDGKPYTLADDLTVDGPVRSDVLPAPSQSVDVDGLRVSMGDDLSFEVTRDGRPVALQDYLGAKGHLVALRQGDLAFLHVHPDQDSLRFEAAFPTPGSYRLFLQFKTADGHLHTAAFTKEVAR
jgi:hypothetical protein